MGPGCQNYELMLFKNLNLSRVFLDPLFFLSILYQLLLLAKLDLG